LFEKPQDYAAFMRAVIDARSRVWIPLNAYCVMPNHFHFVVGPVEMTVLSAFMHRFTVMHSKRWHKHHGTFGTGPVYQGRFNAKLIKDDAQFIATCRYVECNPAEAELVERAEDWAWSSLRPDRRFCKELTLDPWPILRPMTWDEQETGYLKKPGFL
jgi:putative transposase